jgi:ribose transport system permease protein
MTTLPRQVVPMGGTDAPGRRRLPVPVAAIAPWAILLALYVVYILMQSNAFTVEQTGVILIGALPLIFAAAGQTIPILTGGIDLSVGGMISLTSCLAATRMQEGSVAEWVILILLAGALGGVVNGVLITQVRIQPFVATLGTWSVFSGIALLVLPTQGGLVPNAFANIAFGHVAGIPAGILFVVALLLLWGWLKRTRFLRRIYAVGSSAESARLSGVSVARTLVSAYALSGLLAAAAGLALAMSTASGDPAGGTSYILPSIAAVVIGGTSLLGGRGGVGGTVAGALILTLISNVVFQIGLAQYWTPVIQGVLIIVAVLAGAVALARQNLRETTP